MTVTTVAHYRIDEDDTALLDDLRAIADLTRAEPGNEYFHIIRDGDERDHIVLVEGWRDARALADHRETAHFHHLVQSVAPRLRSREVTVGSPLFSDAFA